MKKSNYRISAIITYIIISILAFAMTYNYVVTKEKQLLEKKYSALSYNLKDKIASLVEKKKNATLALTITLANNTDVIKIINNKNYKNDKLHKLSLLLRRETAFKNVWFQVIDKKGYSLFRSWSKKRGDALYKVRQDLRDMLEEPTIRSTISVGRYDMTFKAMVPIYEEGKFVGIIESITHFNSISRGLRISDNVEPLILAEEKFTAQLTKPFTKLFVDNHYIANISANKEIIQKASELGVKRLTKIKDYKVFENYLVINHPIYYANEKLGSFVVFKKLDLIDTISIEEYKSNAFFYLGLFIVLLGLIIYIISYYLYSKEITKLYNQLHKNQVELKDLNESLKQTIDEEIEKNDKKNKIMFHQSKLAAMGEMIGNIAHQWRQPLSVITTVASGIKLKKDLGVSNEEDEIESLNSIINSANYLSNTIDDFRYFFSPNKNRTIFKSEQFIEKVLGLINSDFKLKNIKIIKKVEPLNIEGFENELLQVLLNIVNNAKDELVKNEDLEKKLVFIKLYEENENVVISIKDNAGGIPNHLIDRIFEPYFTTKHQSRGTGIGLYMSEEIISKHMDGSIIVNNEEYIYENTNYRGACFKIILPKPEN